MIRRVCAEEHTPESEMQGGGVMADVWFWFLFLIIVREIISINEIFRNC